MSSTSMVCLPAATVMRMTVCCIEVLQPALMRHSKACQGSCKVAASVHCARCVCTIAPCGSQQVPSLVGYARGPCHAVASDCWPCTLNLNLTTAYTPCALGLGAMRPCNNPAPRQCMTLHHEHPPGPPAPSHVPFTFTLPSPNAWVPNSQRHLVSCADMPRSKINMPLGSMLAVRWEASLLQVDINTYSNAVRGLAYEAFVPHASGPRGNASTTRQVASTSHWYIAPAGDAWYKVGV